MRTKTKKTILTSLLALLLVVTMIFAVACGDNNSTVEPTVRLASLSLSGQKTTFAHGEEFSVGNLVVTAKYTDNTTKVLTDSQYDVESGAYSKTVAGNYKIVVTAKGTKVSSSYMVTVQEKAILPAPTIPQGIYAYNNLDPVYNDDILNHPEPGLGIDTEWQGRYTVNVFAPDDEQNAQQVGMIAAWSQLHGAQLGMSSVGMFDFNGTVVVRITTNFEFEKVDIRPFSLDIQYQRVEGLDNTIEFTLTRPCNLSIEFDEDLAKNLMLFSDYLKEYSKPSDEFVADVQNAVDENADNLIIVPTGTVNWNTISEQFSDTKHNVILFGAGIYNINGGSGKMSLPTNSTVYIHGDSAVFGSINFAGGKNINIKGRGIVSARKGAGTIAHITNVNNLVMEGILLSYSQGWTNVLTDSQDVTYRNVRVAGARINNNDGFDICSSSDVLVDGCFIRTIDDCVTIKCHTNRPYVENIVVQNTTLWNYQGGNGMIVGSESRSDVYDNIIVRNVDIIHNSGNRALCMEILDSATVTNVVFDDIRLELENDFGATAEKGNPNAPTHNYTSDADNVSPLIQFEIITNADAFYGQDAGDGVIDGVIFNNITFNGNQNRKILLKGTGPNNQVKNVQLNNVSFNGVLLNDFNSDDYIQSGSNYYSNVRFTSDELYYQPNANGLLIDDKQMLIDVFESEQMENSNLTGGGYTNGIVRLTDSIKAKFNVSAEGSYMPYVNLKLGERGGLFDVYFDGKLIGNVNTYSVTSEYMQYYLPMDFVTAGEHEITFTARSVPNANFDGYFLDIGIDYLNFVNMGQNFIEFESLTSQATIISDYRARGELAVDVDLQQGQTIDFVGSTARPRDAQLHLGYLAGPDKGIYKFYYNGQLISNDIDMYSPTFEYREIALDTVSLTQQNFTLTAKCVGKNTLSTGTTARLDYIKTWHMPVKISQKAGYDGFYNNVVVSSGINITRGYFQPVALSNITKDGTITCNQRLMQTMDGVYECSIYLSNYNNDAFDFYFNNQPIDYTFENGVISFVIPYRYGLGTTIFTFVCKGDGTYAFNINKVELAPIEIDKTELRALVEAEDVRVFGSDVASNLVDQHKAILSRAKDVLFDRMTMQSDIDLVLDTFEDIIARIEDDAVRYNQATLSDGTVTVNFQNAQDDQLATLYVDNGTNQAVYYALVKDNQANFTVGSAFVGSQVKLYCQVVDNPFANAQIEQGEKISVAQPFTFSNDYYNAQSENAFLFETLSNCDTMTATFDTTQVVTNDVAMLTIRNGLNQTLATVYAAIDKQGVATFEIPTISQSNVYAVVKVSGKEIVQAQSVVAQNVKISDFHLGKAIANGIDDKNIAITSTIKPNEQGVISYSAKCGWISQVITVTNNGGFDFVELDMSILRYCGSGGSDAVFIKSAQQQSLVTCSATDNGLREGSYRFSYEQCGGAIRLELWYGCRGDHSQCSAEPPHANEEIILKAVRFYKNIQGTPTTLKLIGNNPIEVADAKVFSATVLDTLIGADSLTATGDFANGDQVTLVLMDENQNLLGSFNATCVDAGTVTFAITNWTYQGSVYAYFMTENGCVTAETVDASISESFHLGKALYNLDAGSEGWTIAKLNGALNINEQGVIYTNETSSWKYNYWISADTRPSNGYDYTFTFNGNLSDVESISIPYTFVKKCNCGGMDWFYIVNAGKVVGSFSCQDKAVTTYSGTITISSEVLATCTSNTFHIFYGFGCSTGNHKTTTSETLEFGQMVVVRKVIATQREIVFIDFTKYPAFKQD